MTDTVGFWTLANEDPNRLAVVDPSGAEVTYGELDAAANRLVHGLRGLGLTTGDGVAAVLPNGFEMVALYFAAMQAGWYLTPINHHLVGPEIAYIVEDCEAGAFIGHERFAEPCRAAADELSLPADRWFSVGDVPGFRSLAELTDTVTLVTSGEFTNVHSRERCGTVTVAEVPVPFTPFEQCQALA